MDSARWKRIEELYGSMLDHSPEQRLSLLERLCPDDPEMRCEVESLLKAREGAGGFLSTEQFREFITDIASDPQVPGPGSIIGPYQIVAELGAGSMGEVYRARDIRLDREVALKILPARFTTDAERVTRFRSEAKAASALNHPNIFTVFDIGQAGETWYIAAELIEGVTLRERLAGGKLPVSEAIRIGVECALALDAAHRAGIVHRDIKPENIMLRTDGVLKIVDFGLARMIADDQAPIATQSGSVMGTPRYMSPEQARGEKLDARSDVFSLGAVLYELLTGEPVFGGSTVAEVFAALLSSERRTFGGDPLGKVLAKVLARDRSERFSTAREFADELRKIESNPTGPLALFVSRQASRVSRTAAVTLAIAVVLILCAMVAALQWGNRLFPGAQGEAAKLVPLTTFSGSKDDLSFSPDGRRFAFSWSGADEAGGGHHIYVKPIQGGDPVQLTYSPEEDRLPVWSPDGKQIAFCRTTGPGECSIYVTPSGAGGEHSVARCGEGVAWSPDGKWLALADRRAPKGSGRLFLLSLSSGERRELTRPKNGRDEYPVFSPDGRRIAFMHTVSDKEVFIIDTAGGLARQITFDGNPKQGRVAWTADGREIVYATAREYGGAGLWRVSAVGGPPRRIYPTLEFAGSPAISPAGNWLAYTESRLDSNIYRADGPRYTASGVPGPFGRARQLIASSREDHSPSFSPDGKRIVFVSNRSGDSELWASTIDGSEATQLTHLEGFAGTPRWSPDGQWIAFDYIERGRGHIWVISASGGTPRQLTNGTMPDTKPSWSPDSAWIYFNSDRSGRPEVWKMKADGTTAQQLTHGGGREPLVSVDGRTVYYTKGFPRGSIWSIPADGGPERAVAGMERFDRVGRLWGVARGGIYFVSEEAGGAPSVIRFFEFSTRGVTNLGEWDRRTDASAPGLALSSDGSRMLIVRTDQRMNDLIMVENFR